MARKRPFRQGLSFLTKVIVVGVLVMTVCSVVMTGLVYRLGNRESTTVVQVVQPQMKVVQGPTAPIKKPATRPVPDPECYSDNDGDGFGDPKEPTSCDVCCCTAGNHDDPNDHDPDIPVKRKDAHKHY